MRSTKPHDHFIRAAVFSSLFVASAFGELPIQRSAYYGYRVPIYRLEPAEVH